MTLTTPLQLERAAPVPECPAGVRRDQLEVLCAVLAFIGLGYALMHFGGRARGSTEVGVALALPWLVVGRAWRMVPVREHVFCAILAVAVVAVPLVTPLGVSRARDIEAYLYAVVLYLAVRGFARDPERRNLIAVGVLCLGIVETLDVVRVWKGEHDPSFQVVGTFYWHNQFGAFAAGIALLGTAMVMRSDRREDGIAWLVAPIFLSLTWLSQSRAAILAFLIAGLALPVVAALRRQWWAIARAACAVGLAIAVHTLFIASVSGGDPHGFSPAKDSLSSTSHFRLDAGEEAMKVFAQAPLVSHGYGSLVVAGWRDARPGMTISPYAHSAEAQALADGGLVLGLPVISALLLLSWSAIRTGLRSARRAKAPDWLPLGASLGALAMLMHTSVDFDSQYSVLGALLVVLIANSAASHPPLPRARRARLSAISVAVTLAATAFSALLVADFFQTSDRLDRATAALPTDSARSAIELRHALARQRFTDPRPAMTIVEIADEGSVVFDQQLLSQALATSRPDARIDPRFARVWNRVSAEVRASSPPRVLTPTAG